MPEVPKGRGIARNALADSLASSSSRTFRPKAGTALANPEAQSVSAGEVVVMAGSARNIPVPGQDFVIEKQPPQIRLRRIDGNEILR